GRENEAHPPEAVAEFKPPTFLHRQLPVVAAATASPISSTPGPAAASEAATSSTQAASAIISSSTAATAALFAPAPKIQKLKARREDPELMIVSPEKKPDIRLNHHDNRRAPQPAVFDQTFFLPAIMDLVKQQIIPAAAAAAAAAVSAAVAASLQQPQQATAASAPVSATPASLSATEPLQAETSTGTAMPPNPVTPAPVHKVRSTNTVSSSSIPTPATVSSTTTGSEHSLDAEILSMYGTLNDAQKKALLHKIKEAKEGEATTSSTPAATATPAATESPAVATPEVRHEEEIRIKRERSEKKNIHHQFWTSAEKKKLLCPACNDLVSIT
ncbi:hypothetical protein PMAYCL1PPCAC_32113, partial [Pristionchus mayeri]